MKKTDLLASLGNVDIKHIIQAEEHAQKIAEKNNRQDDACESDEVGIMDNKTYIRKKIQPIIAVAASVILCVGVLIYITMRNDKDKLTENTNNASSSVSESTTESESTTDSTEIENAYQQGYDDGYSAAYSIGYNEGYSTAYDKGYDEGYSAAYDEGYDEGYSAALEDGYNENYSYEDPVNIRVSGEFAVYVCDFVPFYGNNPEENSLAVVQHFQGEMFLVRMDESIADEIEASQTYVFTIDENFYVVPSHYIIDGRVSPEILRIPYVTVKDYRLAEGEEFGVSSLCDLTYTIEE